LEPLRTVFDAGLGAVDDPMSAVVRWLVEARQGSISGSPSQRL
jgi:hypothetical protein